MSDFGLAQWPYFGGPRPECRECSYCVVESDTDSLGASHMVFSYCSFDHGECPHAGRKPETVAHPDHYTWRGTECKEIIEAMTEGLNGIEAYYMGNIIKYLYRYPKKGTLIQDLRKAAQYVEFLLEHFEKMEENDD